MATIFKRKSGGPYVIQYFDHTGRRRERSSRTTDLRVARRLASKLEADTALRRDGVIDPTLDKHLAAEGLPIRRHVEEYLRHLRVGDRSPRTIANAKSHLDWILDQTSAVRLSDVTLDAVMRALDGLLAQEAAARTINHYGGSIRAFLRWCARTGRIQVNPLQHLPRRNEEQDRKRIRRALTDEELTRLFEIANERGRGLWYRLAFWAGLRRGELPGLCWGDIDLDRGALTVRKGKSRRVDEIPIHPEIARYLAGVERGLPAAQVFPTTVTNRTRQRDFERAGIEDKDGKVADLHSLRVTLGTRLAREGVPPQIAQRIMRHADYRTTLQFYTDLQLSDDAAALARIQAPGAGPSSTPSTQGTKRCDSVPRRTKSQRAATNT